MSGIVSKYINNIISEVCLDARVESGVVDINNITHREIIAEHLFDLGVDIQTVTEIVNDLAIRDGKYPDRQAYNKEGWLVTFPSPEYKNAAVKKGTHFASDPTHGKGGMHLYYKKKGKQKRMVQQDPTQTEPSQPSEPSAPPVKEPAQQAAQPDTTPPQNSTPTTPPSDDADGSSGSALPPSGGESGDEEGDPDAVPQAAKDYENKPKGVPAAGQNPQGAAQQAPAPVVPVTPSFTNISVEFAKNKQWNPTPYGEWRNAIGDVVAVVGLGGEVVPIKSTDREELKLFVKKRQP